MRVAASLLCVLTVTALSACGSRALHSAAGTLRSTTSSGVCAEQVQAQVACLQHAVSNDAPWLRAHNIHLASWGPSPKGDRLVITVVKANPRTLNLLRQRYGGRQLELRSVDALPRAV